MTVVSDRSFHLDRTPRRVAPGKALVVKGRLSPGFHDPELLFLSDGEKILRVPPTDRGLSSKGEQVTFRFAPPRRGQVLAEVLLTGPLGPTVGALFPLSVGEDPPDSFTLEPPPDESFIRSAADAEDRVIELVNRERVARHLPALIRSATGDRAARAFAQASLRSGILAHLGQEGDKASDRLAAVGIAAAKVAENLARNTTIEDAHRSLMRSLGHRKNILDREVDHIAVGVATKPPVIDGIDQRDFWVVCEFFRAVPDVDAERDGRTLRDALNVRRADANLPLLKGNDDLDMLANKLAGTVLRTRNVEPPGLAPMLDQALSMSGDRWKAWALQVYRVALPLDEATDASGALDARYTHVGIGLAQPSLRLAPDDVRTAVVFVLAARATAEGARQRRFPPTLRSPRAFSVFHASSPDERAATSWACWMRRRSVSSVALSSAVSKLALARVWSPTRSEAPASARAWASSKPLRLAWTRSWAGVSGRGTAATQVLARAAALSSVIMSL